MEVVVQFELRYGRAVHAGHNLGSVGDMMLKSNDMSFVVELLFSFMSRLAGHINSRSGSANRSWCEHRASLDVCFVHEHDGFASQ